MNLKTKTFIMMTRHLHLAAGVGEDQQKYSKTLNWTDWHKNGHSPMTTTIIIRKNHSKKS